MNLPNRRRISILFSILLLFIGLFIGEFSPLNALESGKKLTQYRLQVWNMESGLPDNNVLAVRQTRDGYLWIGTQDGLVRFDGFNFQLYTKENVAQLKDNQIRALYEDENGCLWIGTSSGGLTRYNDGAFENYPVETFKSLFKIKAIAGDRWGNVWIGSYTEGLSCFSRGKLTTYTTKHGLPHNQVNAISRDQQGDLWMTTAGGIVKLVKPGTFRLWVKPESTKVNMLAALYKEEKKELWIGTADRFLFCSRNGKSDAYGENAGIPCPTIPCLFEDRSRNLWIGTDGGGLTRMENGVFSTLSVRDGLAAGYVSCICEDREGSLWVGTLDGGLHQLRNSNFTIYTSREGLSDNFIQCVLQDRIGNLWIGTMNGLNRLKLNGETRGTGSVASISAMNQGPLTNNSVVCLHEDPGGSLWIGTWGGLYRFNNGRLTVWTPKDGLCDNRINCIGGDRNGDIWVGTQGGLSRYNPATGKFWTYTTRDGLSSNIIRFVFEDRHGSIRIGTNHGLNVLNDEKITPNPSSFGIFGNGNYFFHTAYEDQEGTLWFGTDSGLLRYTPKDDIYLYNIQSGLIENGVHTILEDDCGYLWLAGKNGISRIRKRELTDLALGRIRKLHPDRFNEKDGMNSRWCEGISCKSRDGRLWFPTSLGLTMIDPNHIKTNKTPPSLLIEKMIVDGDPVHIQQTQRFFGRERRAAFSKRAPLELAPGKKRFEFYYTALSFINPKKIRFKIKLDGYDKGWVDMDNLRNTTYTSLSPGLYTFKVIACNSDGVWNQTGASLSFYLRPYFYQTPWFYLAVVMVIFLAVFFFHHFRLRQLRARKEELGTLVDIRTRDLQKRTLELENAHQELQQNKSLIEEKNRQLEDQSEKLKELDKAKSSFFANISHEFRTPLTLINGPLEQILAGNPDKDLEAQATLMLRNSRHLLNLVDQLLELAKFDSGKMKLRATLQNITPFLRSVILCFESLASQSKIDLTFQSDSEDIPLYFDPDKLERVVINIVSNAFNYTPSGGTIAVSVRHIIGTAYPEGSIEIVVRDTGSGIPSDELPYIFDRFYRGKGSYENRRKGTGIGLALVKDLVELHRGQIDVQSNYLPNQAGGTIFVIRLPLGNAHLQPDEMIHISDYKSDSKKDKTAAIRVPVWDHPSAPEEKEKINGEPCNQNQKPNVLIVEDNADMRTYIRGILESNYTISEAVNGKEGMMTAEAMIPDLVLSDVMMPEMDGYELCSHLKKEFKTCHIPVILLTAKASEASMRDGLETGADDYIVKPFSADLLEVRVRNLIRLRRQLQQKIRQDMLLQPSEVSVSSMDHTFLKELRTIIEKNLADPEFNVEQLANKLYLSLSTLRRKLEALTGETAGSLIRSYRLTRAAQLLKGNFGNVTEVAFAVGFSDAAYFAKCFKDKFHQTPRDYANS
ncbi:MAG: two-component regulator propeller domain-containing protein [Candidatus Omnitrophota bacterium]